MASVLLVHPTGIASNFRFEENFIYRFRICGSWNPTPILMRYATFTTTFYRLGGPNSRMHRHTTKQGARPKTRCMHTVPPTGIEIAWLLMSGRSLQRLIVSMTTSGKNTFKSTRRSRPLHILVSTALRWDMYYHTILLALERANEQQQNERAQRSTRAKRAVWCKRTSER